MEVIAVRDWIAIVGIAVQVMLGGLAFYAALTWRTEYLGRRKLETAAELAFWAKAYTDVVRQELSVRIGLQGGLDSQQLQITLDQTLVSTEEAWREVQRAWIRAMIDLDADKIGEVMGEFVTLHWNVVLERRIPYDSERAQRDKEHLEALSRAIDEQLIPLTRG